MTIDPAALIISTSDVSKVYDGTAIAPVRLASSGVLAGDNVGFSGSSQFADTTAGTAKPVNVSAIAVTGADAGNYSSNTSASTTADIMLATLTHLANTKSAAAGWLPNGLTGTVNGLVGGDTLTTATTGTLSWSTHQVRPEATPSMAVVWPQRTISSSRRRATPAPCG